MNAPASASTVPVTVVTQTRVLPGFEEAFAVWQEQTSAAIAAMPGFRGQTVMRPSPPLQVDWVIQQRFDSSEAAIGWLRSPERLARVTGAQSMLVGQDDVHIVTDGQGGPAPAPVSAVISTRVKPGRETDYRAWEQRIAGAQTKAPGFQGYRFQPPIPGVQEDWVSILRFDSEANLQAWLGSTVRRTLLAEAEQFTDEFHTRVARTGFEQWFKGSDAAATIPAWKQNMIVLLLLYPIVSLFGMLISRPLLEGRLGLSFPVALFIGNLASVVALSFLVPWLSGWFDWWLSPRRRDRRVDAAGAVLVGVLCLVLIAVFNRLS